MKLTCWTLLWVIPSTCWKNQKPLRNFANEQTDQKIATNRENSTDVWPIHRFECILEACCHSLTQSRCCCSLLPCCELFQHVDKCTLKIDKYLSESNCWKYEQYLYELQREELRCAQQVSTTDFPKKTKLKLKDLNRRATQTYINYRSGQFQNFLFVDNVLRVTI